MKPDSDVRRYIEAVENPGRRDDAWTLLELMHEASGEPPRCWGNLIGFGRYHYRYDSGREGDAPLVAFAPRKANMVVYIMPGFSTCQDSLAKLGKHKTGKSCLYLGRLEAIDLEVLRKLVRESVVLMRERYNVPAP